MKSEPPEILLKRNYSAWQEILKNIPDAIFFEITRTYLGKLQTPFNKSDLIRQLVQFFSRPEIRETVFSYLNEEDKRFLSIIAYFDSLDANDLWKMLKEQYSYRELRSQLLNLEERFLIYSFIRKGKRYYAVSPLFGIELCESYLSLESISPGGIIETEPRTAPLLFDDFFLTGFYSRLFHDKLNWKNNNSLTAKSIQDLETLFNLKSWEENDDSLEHLNSFFFKSGLITRTGNKVSPANDNWNNLAEWSPQKRALYLLDGILNQYKGFKKEASHFLKSLVALLGNKYSVSLELFDRLTPALHSEDSHLIRRLLTETGFLIEHEGFLSLNHWWITEEDHYSPLIVNQNFDILLPSGFPFTPELCRMCEAHGFDMYAHLHLTRTSFLRGLEKEKEIFNPIEILESLTQKNLPQNIAFSIQEWKHDFGSIKLDKGVLLRISPEKTPVIESTGILDPYIICQPLPGVYLLDESSEKNWREAFEHLEIGYLPSLSTKKTFTSQNRLIEPVNLKLTRRQTNLPLLTRYSEKEENTTKFRKMLKSYLETQNNIPPEEKEILRQHIERKLIVSRDQITPGAVKPRLNTAKGFDYNGKLRLIENSISERNCLLELSLPGTGWEPLKKLIYPLKIEKDEKNKKNLYGSSLPEEEDFTCAIEKIVAVKLIRNSFF